jgi:hypothetical protein
MVGAIIFLAFHHSYQPIAGSIVLSAIVAGIPLYALFFMLAVLRLPAWIAAVTRSRTLPLTWQTSSKSSARMPTGST